MNKNKGKPKLQRFDDVDMLNERIKNESPKSG